MSKYSDGFEQRMKDIKSVGKETKEILAKGGKIAFKEIHGAHSLDRLEKKLRGENYGK